MKDQDIGKMLDELREKYGPGVARMANRIGPVELMPTGVEKLDKILGGGWPKGRISEIWGPQSAGKSTLVCRSIAACQRANPRSRIAYYDLENSFSPEWAEKMGVDMSRLLVIGAVAADDLDRLLVRMVRKKWDMVIVDSIVELQPEKVLQRGIDEETYATVARVLSVLLPKLVVLQSSSPTVVLLVNQVRDKIGFRFGAGQKSPGGQALFHMDSVKLRVQRKGFIEGKRKKRVGFVMAIKVVKTKIYVEGLDCRLTFMFGQGIVDK